jgi:hypothetical protein
MKLRYVKVNNQIIHFKYFSRTKSRISSTGSSFSEDINRGRTISESDPRRISETEESRGTVTIYDVLPLWPFSSALAQRYFFKWIPFTFGLFTLNFYLVPLVAFLTFNIDEKLHVGIELQIQSKLFYILGIKSLAMTLS